MEKIEDDIVSKWDVYVKGQNQEMWKKYGCSPPRGKLSVRIKTEDVDQPKQESGFFSRRSNYFNQALIKKETIDSVQQSIQVKQEPTTFIDLTLCERPNYHRQATVKEKVVDIGQRLNQTSKEPTIPECNFDEALKDLDLDEELFEDEENLPLNNKQVQENEASFKPKPTASSSHQKLNVFDDSELNHLLDLYDDDQDLRLFEPNLPARNLRADDILKDTEEFDLSNVDYTKRLKPTRDQSINHEISKDLVPVTAIPEEYQSIFQEFTHFNQVQSKVFKDVYHSDKSIVVSAPTGSGKTVIFELAIVRELHKPKLIGEKADNFKAIFIAPLKTLCSQRYLEWREKFRPFDLDCTEFTGDSETGWHRTLLSSSIVFTTPEKWNTLIGYKAFNDIVKSIRLVLIDEVHLLNDKFRGPKLEATITRLKLLQKDTDNDFRFLAVSATAPNSEDLGQWLANEIHGFEAYKLNSSFRPVKLEKKIIGYDCPESMNDFVFNYQLDNRLPGLIQSYAKKRPTLIFVSTRKACPKTCETLAKSHSYWYDMEHRNTLQRWSRQIKDSKLREILKKGIGYHHAGLCPSDRHEIEQGFLRGLIPVLVSTSSLAMGVNFPAHLVIIRGTSHYISGTIVEYTESEILQMMGRAGRPQFDDEGVVIVMTKKQLESKYRKLADGTQIIESNLQNYLCEIFMAEIHIQTIRNLEQAIDWIHSTFFYLRIHKNPVHYGLEASWNSERIEQKIKDICIRELNGLAKFGLITMSDDHENIEATELGRMMAIRSISFDTMRHFLELKGDETLEGLLAVICKCKDLTQDVSLRNSDRKFLHQLNSKSKTEPTRTIRYPVTSRLKGPESKIKILIQAVLGCLTIPKESGLAMEAANIIKVGKRLSRCLQEVAWLRCEHSQLNFRFLLNCVVLNKSFQAELWENSRYVCKQLKKVGIASANALVEAGFTTFKSLREADPRQIEMFLPKNTASYGNFILQEVKQIPVYDVWAEDVKPSPQSAARAAVLITIKIVNLDIVKENVKDSNSRFRYHSCILIVGDQDGNLLFKDKVLDRAIVESKAPKYQATIEINSSVKTLAIHYISETLAGVDENFEYRPRPGPFTFNQPQVKKIHSINGYDQISKLTTPSHPKRAKTDEILLDDTPMEMDVQEERPVSSKPDELFGPMDEELFEDIPKFDIEESFKETPKCQTYSHYNLDDIFEYPEFDLKDI